jgi:hypothetical protein
MIGQKCYHGSSGWVLVLKKAGGVRLRPQLQRRDSFSPRLLLDRAGNLEGRGRKGTVREERRGGNEIDINRKGGVSPMECPIQEGFYGLKSPKTCKKFLFLLRKFNTSFTLIMRA